MDSEKKAPEIRFGGYSEPWNEQILGDAATFLKGSGYSKADLTDTGTPIILYGRLYTKYETTIDEVDTYAAMKGSAVFSQGGEVIVPSSGETSEDIARASAVAQPGVILGGDLNIVRANESVDPAFLALTISNGTPHRELIKKAQGKSVVHIRNSDLKEIEFFAPEVNEQSAIGNFFRNLDDIIALKKQQHEQTANIKKAMLEKMFPKNGADAPEIRFEGFVGAWEMATFGTVCNIVRGGSPRPIESYVTTLPNGINWIKIGDVDKNAKYIKRTEEKIKPEGLPMSRLVKAGDFILSNSMSFGRPYIMQIEGCIHDGWLAIQNYTEKFDTEFLYYLLASDCVLRQYRERAAGSTVKNLNKDLVASIDVVIPHIDEQLAIAKYMSALDNLIDAYQEELEKLQNIKSACLSKMLV